MFFRTEFRHHVESIHVQGHIDLEFLCLFPHVASLLIVQREKSVLQISSLFFHKTHPINNH